MAEYGEWHSWDPWKTLGRRTLKCRCSEMWGGEKDPKQGDNLKEKPIRQIPIPGCSEDTGLPLGPGIAHIHIQDHTWGNDP